MIAGVEQNGISEKVNAAMRNSRDICELVGVCKGVLADGSVSLQEALFMLNWLEMHNDCINIWPASILFTSLDKMLEDGELDNTEEAELLDLLTGIIGQEVIIETKSGPEQAQTPASLPYSEPASGISFPDKTFCLTGTFHTGTRPACEEMILSRGGIIQKAPTKKTDYLIVGSIGSKDWAHSSFGRKIQKAADMSSQGLPIAICSEEFWSKYL